MNEQLNIVSDSPETGKTQFRIAFTARDTRFINLYFAKHGKEMLRDLWLVKYQCSRSRDDLMYALSIGFKINSGDNHNGWNVAHWSAYEGNLEMFSYFWQTYPQLRASLTPKGDFLTSVGNGYENVLHCAARGSQSHIIQFICAQNTLDVNAVAAHEKTAIYWSMTNADRLCSLWLIFYGANPERKDSEGKNVFDHCQDRYIFNPTGGPNNVLRLEFARQVMRLAAIPDPVAKSNAIREAIDVTQAEIDRYNNSGFCTIL